MALAVHGLRSPQPWRRQSAHDLSLAHGLPAGGWSLTLILSQNEESESSGGPPRSFLNDFSSSSHSLPPFHIVICRPTVQIPPPPPPAAEGRTAPPPPPARRPCSATDGSHLIAHVEGPACTSTDGRFEHVFSAKHFGWELPLVSNFLERVLIRPTLSVVRRAPSRSTHSPPGKALGIRHEDAPATMNCYKDVPAAAAQRSPAITRTGLAIIEGAD